MQVKNNGNVSMVVFVWGYMDSIIGKRAVAWANVTTCPSVGPPIFGRRGKITDKRVIQTIAHRVNDGHRLMNQL